MSEQKEPLGFKTPAMNIQKELNEVQAILAESGKWWGDMHNLFMSRADENAKELKIRLDSIKAKGEVTNTDLLELMNVQGLWSMWIIGIIGKIGSELTSVHERLAGIEKLIKENKLSTK